MKLRPFKEMIALSKEKIDEAMAPIRATLVKSRGAVKLAELDEQLLTKQSAIMDACTKKDLDFDSVSDMLDDVALLERRKEQITKIVDELFPAETAA